MARNPRLGVVLSAVQSQWYRDVPDREGSGTEDSSNSSLPPELGLQGSTVGCFSPFTIECLGIRKGRDVKIEP